MLCNQKLPLPARNIYAPNRPYVLKTRTSIAFQADANAGFQ
jgi:hypothetical protein